MTRKIALNYDDATGALSMDDGTIVIHWSGIKGHDVTAGSLSVDDLIALKRADFTVDEIAELKRQKLI